MKTFYVPVLYRGQSNFVIRAKNEEAAKTEAVRRFNEGVEPDICGSEWEIVDRIGDITESVI